MAYVVLVLITDSDSHHHGFIMTSYAKSDVNLKFKPPMLFECLIISLGILDILFSNVYSEQMVDVEKLMMAVCVCGGGGGSSTSEVSVRGLL